MGSSNLENPRRDTGFIKTDRSVNQAGGPRGTGGADAHRIKIYSVDIGA